MDDSSTVSYNASTYGIYNGYNSSESNEMIINGGAVSNHNQPSEVGNVGGIWNSDASIMTINDCTVSDHSETGIKNGSVASLTLNRVTVNNNGSLLTDEPRGYPGTGIYMATHGTLTLNNSTVSGNGYGIIAFLSEVLIRSSTVSGNVLSGIFSNSTRLELINTIVAGNGTNDCENVQGTIISLGYNLDSDGTCNLIEASDLPSTIPELGPLQDNGGPTWTQALLAWSPAIDAGTCNDDLYPTDQRGITRPQGLDCDIGAYEYVFGGECENDIDAPVVSGTTASPNPVEVDTEVTLTALVEDSCSNIQYAQYNVDGGAWSSEYYPGGTSNSETISMNIYSVSGPGVLTVCVRGTDEAGNISDEECIYLPVYDPSAGFVTGGGWIDSPEGAYVVDPSATGKANFGFVAKYKKGATVPDGNTEFQFKAADLKFHSSEYEWLVVTGSNYAKFKGSGTINGAGSYKFQIWAGDDDTDTFRIKIWEEDAGGNETVTYDNGFDQAIGGGNIVIHKK